MERDDNPSAASRAANSRKARRDGIRRLASARADLSEGTPERLSLHSVEDIRRGGGRRDIGPDGPPDGGEQSRAD